MRALVITALQVLVVALVIALLAIYAPDAPLKFIYTEF